MFRLIRVALLGGLAAALLCGMFIGPAGARAQGQYGGGTGVLPIVPAAPTTAPRPFVAAQPTAVTAAPLAAPLVPAPAFVDAPVESVPPAAAEFNWQPVPRPGPRTRPSPAPLLGGPPPELAVAEIDTPRSVTAPEPLAVLPPQPSLRSPAGPGLASAQVLPKAGDGTPQERPWPPLILAVAGFWFLVLAIAWPGIRRRSRR